MPPIDVVLIHVDDEMVIIHSVYSDPWTWDDFYNAFSREEHITRTAGGRTIYRVLDLTQTRFVPSGLFQHFRKMARRLAQAKSPYETTVIVTTNPHVLAVGTILNRLFPKAALHIRHAATVPDAYILIQRLSGDSVLWS